MNNENEKHGSKRAVFALYNRKSIILLGMRFYQRFLFGVLVTGTRSAFGVDVASFRKRHFRKRRADQFIDKHGKQRDTYDDLRDVRTAEFRRAFYHVRHTERYARLRQ